MKKITKKITACLFALSLLTGCAGLSFDVSEGEGFFEKEHEYTVIVPNNDGGEIISEENPKKKNVKTNENDFSEDKEEYPDNEINEAVSENKETDSEEIFENKTEEETLSTISEGNVENNEETTSESTDEIITESNKTSYITESKIYSRTADVSRQVKELIDSMSKEEKAAQLILARCPPSGADELMAKYGFGGYTFYAADFKDRNLEDAKEFIAKIRYSADITPFFAVDEEGGDIVRISKYPAYRDFPFRSPGEIYSESGLEGIISDSAEKAKLLCEMGININLAPVCDIANEGDYIYDRTLGASAYETGEAVREIVNISGEYGLMSCLKHFPGYGSNVDTHTGIAYDSRSKDSFVSNDFIPFKSGISGRYTPAVLVNHNIVECMDSTAPASLSPEVHRVLREELYFDGVIITDDLGMDGISAYTGNISPYVMGIMSGNDLLCVSDPEGAYNDLISAINDGTLPMETVDEHLRRILQMKKDYGLI